jgi:hypothetical protein
VVSGSDTAPEDAGDPFASSAPHARRADRILALEIEAAALDAERWEARRLATLPRLADRPSSQLSATT